MVEFSKIKINKRGYGGMVDATDLKNQNLQLIRNIT